MPTAIVSTPPLACPLHHHRHRNRHNPEIGIIIDMPIAAYLRTRRRTTPQSVHHHHVEPWPLGMARVDGRSAPRPIRDRPIHLSRVRTCHRRRKLPRPTETDAPHQRL